MSNQVEVLKSKGNPLGVEQFIIIINHAEVSIIIRGILEPIIIEA